MVDIRANGCSPCNRCRGSCDACPVDARKCEPEVSQVRMSHSTRPNFVRILFQPQTMCFVTSKKAGGVINSGSRCVSQEDMAVRLPALGQILLGRNLAATDPTNNHSTTQLHALSHSSYRTAFPHFIAATALTGRCDRSGHGRAAFAATVLRGAVVSNIPPVSTEADTLSLVPQSGCQTSWNATKRELLAKFSDTNAGCFATAFWVRCQPETYSCYGLCYRRSKICPAVHCGLGMQCTVHRGALRRIEWGRSSFVRGIESRR